MTAPSASIGWTAPGGRAPGITSRRLRRLGCLLLTPLLITGLACARRDWIDRTLVTENVAGVWSGSMTGPSGRPVVWLELRQQGARITGVINLPAYGSLGSYSGPVEGSMAGDVFSFKEARGAYSGELTVAGDDMVGQIFGPMGKRGASLHRGGAEPQPDAAKH